MLTASEARRACALAPPGAPAVVVVDARPDGEPGEYLVHARPWAAGGVRVEPLTGGWPAARVVFLLPEGADDARRRRVQVLARDRTAAAPDPAVDPAFVHSDAAGGLRCGDRLLADAPPAGHTTDVRVVGRGAVDDPAAGEWVHAGDLPLRFAARVPADPAGAVVWVEGDSRSGTALPPGRWFRLPVGPAGPARPVDLEVDIRPAADPARDEWSVTVRGGPAAVSIPRPDPVRVRRLAVVFDRTCPDADQWVRARDLVKGGVVAAGRDAFGDVGGAGVPIGELNAGIRQGLAAGLATALGDAAVDVHLVWFADLPGDGLVSPPGLPLPTAAVGRVPARRAAQVEAAVRTPDFAYSPGLDVWDPLDEALGWVGGDRPPDPATAVLIVGNSPPHMPHRSDNPFEQLVLDPRKGIPSAVRRRGRLGEDFDAVLDDLNRRSVRVGYLFLDGHRTPALEDPAGPAGAVFNQVQAQVHAALGAYRLLVRTADATPHGVRDGVADLVRRLQAEVSLVTVTAGREG